MNVAVLRDFLGWCAIVNYVLLIIWFLVFLFGRDGLYKLYQKWFRLSAEELDRLFFTGMLLYKIGILLFNLVPYLVLRFKV